VWLSEAMRDITALGGGVSIILITFFVAGFMILRKQYSILWFLLFATIGGALLSVGLKELFGRERPTIVLHLMTVNSLSFPSGHSMMSMVVFLTQASLLARIEKSWKIRTYIISIALFLSFIIGISRIYLGVHYPTDVLAGWAMGLTWASICWIAVWYIQRKKAKRKKLKHTEEALDNNSEEYERSDS
jgi:undecaprenyl-diphosphatase